MANSIELNLKELTPNTKIENGDVYFKALDYAFKGKQIRNIALSGPYGSGKSSIIKTYFGENKQYDVCEISLATFDFENSDPIGTTNRETRNEALEKKDNGEVFNRLEKSILEQMIYQTAPKKIPLSRFKRIIKPEKSELLYYSFFAVIFLFTSLLLLNQKIIWPILDFGRFSSLVWIFVSFVCFSIFTYLIVCLYKRFPDLNIKKISISSGEIESDDKLNSSVLNSYLEELLYYFESTKTNVVVFEDLDRFDNYNIFLKLRELNNIVNKYENIKREIYFVYAVKDTILSGINKSKFFDLVIPVIPIVDASNAKDKMLERSACLDRFELTDQLIKDVSIFVPDLRLIHNIFNEFEIYAELLESDGRDYNKLFCYIVYKNTHPVDFSNLYSGKGALYNIVTKLEYFQGKHIANKKTELEGLNEDLKQLGHYKNRSIKDVMDRAILGILKTIPKNNERPYFKVGNEALFILNIFMENNFLKIIDENEITICRGLHTGHQILGVTDELLMDALDGNTYGQEVASIEEAGKNSVEIIHNKISKLEREISNSRLLDLSVVVLVDDIQDECQDNNVKNINLLTYFIKNGYMDQNYNVDISNFHEGTLTSVDNNYLVSVLSQQQLSYEYRLDNPKNVRDQLSKVNFGKAYFLNFQIVDALFDGADPDLNRDKCDNLLHMVSNDLEEFHLFLIKYSNASENAELYRQLLRTPFFAGQVLKLNWALEVLPILVQKLDTNELIDVLNRESELSRVLAANLQVISLKAVEHERITNLLLRLDCKVDDISGFHYEDDLAQFLLENSLFKINYVNVTFAIKAFNNTDSTIVFSYLALVALLPVGVNDYFKSNIISFFEFFLLKNAAKNTQTVEDLKSLMSADKVTPTLKTELLTNNALNKLDFEDIPINIQEESVSKGLCEFDWEQLLVFYEGHENFSEVFSGWIVSRPNISRLADNKLSRADVADTDKRALVNALYDMNQQLPVDKFINIMENTGYIFGRLPEGWTPELASRLVDWKILNYTSSLVTKLEEHDEILSRYIGNHFKSFRQANAEKHVAISTEAISALLESSIKDEDKLFLLTSDFIKADDHKNFGVPESDLIKLLLKAEGRLDLYESALIVKLIQDARGSEAAKNLLLKWIDELAVEQILFLLKTFEYPLSNLGSPSKKPQVRQNGTNAALLKALKSKGIIKAFTLNESKQKYYVTNC